MRDSCDDVKVSIMARCLRRKAERHSSGFGARLLSSGQITLVDESSRDDSWGAIPIDDDILQGFNILRVLLMDLRSEVSP